MVTRFAILGLLVLVAVGGLGIQSANADLKFNLDEIAPLSLTVCAWYDPFCSDDEGLGEFRVDNIECHLKHTVIVYFADGTTKHLDSSQIVANPILNSFLSVDDKEVLRFVVQPKVWCGGGFSGTVHAGIDRNGQENIIVLNVYANLPSGQVIKVHGEQAETISTRFVSGDSVVLPFATFYVTALDVFDSLPAVDYDVTLKFEQTGNISFISGQEEFIQSGKRMWISVNPDQIVSYYNGKNVIQPATDTDGDGIPDSGDNCPTIKENFNGWQDQDGCPDTKPVSGGCPDGYTELINGSCVVDPVYIPPPTPTDKTEDGITEQSCIDMDGVWSSDRVWDGSQFQSVFKCADPPLPDCDEGFIRNENGVCFPFFDDPNAGCLTGLVRDANGNCVKDGCQAPKLIINGVCSDPPTMKNCNGVQIPINDECACADSDNDNICDFADECTFDPETVNGFEDEDGCPDVAPLDGDGDGIPNDSDFCLAELEDGLRFDFVDGVRTATATDGCPSSIATVCEGKSTGVIYLTTESCTGDDGGNGGDEPTAEELTALLGDGRVVPLTTVVYSDGSSDQFIGSIGSTSVFPNIGSVTPAQLTGSTSSDKPKEIDRIDFTLFYVASNELDTSDLSVTRSSGFGIEPTVIISSVQQGVGAKQSLTGSSATVTFGSLPQSIGNGALLGSTTFTARTIETLGFNAGIGEGNTQDVDLNFETIGKLTFTKSLFTDEFNIENNYVQFNDFYIYNEKNVDVDCSKLNPPQVPVLDNQGNQIGCKAPVDPNADSDGDGIKDTEDECPNEQEDGLSPKPFDGCLTGSTPPTQTCIDGSVIGLNEVCTHECPNGNGGIITIPENISCPTTGTTQTCWDGQIIPIEDACRPQVCTPQLSVIGENPCDPNITCDDPVSKWSSPALYEATCKDNGGGFDSTLLAYGGIALVFIAIIVVIIKRR